MSDTNEIILKDTIRDLKKKLRIQSRELNILKNKSECFECKRKIDLFGKPIKLFYVEFAKTKLKLCSLCKKDLEKDRNLQGNSTTRELEE